MRRFSRVIGAGPWAAMEVCEVDGFWIDFEGRANRTC